MNPKNLFIGVGIAAVAVIMTIAGMAAIDAFKPAKENDMTSMHAPPPPADNVKFQSLLGNPAPDFELTSYDGREIKLADFRGKKVVLFFSEGAMCYPSCWEQINSFTNDPAFSKESSSAVLTIVVDSKTDWDSVVTKDPKIAKATVLLDSDRSVSKLYGVLTVASSMHRGQFPGHTYIVIDKDGVVRNELDDPNMGINNEKLLDYISKLN